MANKSKCTSSQIQWGQFWPELHLMCFNYWKEPPRINLCPVEILDIWLNAADSDWSLKSQFRQKRFHLVLCSLSLDPLSFSAPLREILQALPWPGSAGRVGVSVCSSAASPASSSPSWSRNIPSPPRFPGSGPTEVYSWTSYPKDWGGRVRKKGEGEEGRQIGWVTGVPF